MSHENDRRQIELALLKWCRAIDRLDLHAIGDVFHGDAFDDHVFYRGSVDGLINCLRDRHQSISFSNHQLSNILIEFASPTLALVESYVVVVQHLNTPDVSKRKCQTSWCRYVDRFELRDAQWKIASRLLVIDALSEHWDEPGAESQIPHSNQGRRDTKDPIFIARAECGIAS